MDGLLKAKFDVGHQLSDHVIRAATARQGLVGFLAIDRPVAHLMVNKEVKRFADLRGRILAVDSATTGYALLLRYLLRVNGLDPESDVRLEPTGGTIQRLAALEAGHVSGTILEAPNCFVAADLGLHELAVSTSYLPRYQGTVEACLTEWGRGHAEILVGYVRGYLRSWNWLHDPRNQTQALDFLCTHLGVSERAASASYAEQVVGGRFNGRGSLEPGDLEALIHLMVAEGHTAVMPSQDPFWDASYLERAASSATSE